MSSYVRMSEAQSLPLLSFTSTSFWSRLSNTALKSMVFGAIAKPAPKLPNKFDLNLAIVGVLPGNT